MCEAYVHILVLCVRLMYTSLFCMYSMFFWLQMILQDAVCPALLELLALTTSMLTS